MVSSQFHYTKRNRFMPFLLAEILNFQGSTHHIGVGSFSKVVRKFYDSLHYLSLQGKTKPKEYVYILEYPNGDSASRKMIRNRLKSKLPFALQENIGNGIKLIEKVEVLSIAEWNDHKYYGEFPIQHI